MIKMSIVNKSENAPSGIFADLWNDFARDPDFLFQVKADEISVALTSLLMNERVSKAELARRLGWKPSRVSKVLSGSANLTLRTIFDIAQAVGYDFDVVARKKGERQAIQPWQRYSFNAKVILFDEKLRFSDKSKITEERVQTRQVNHPRWENYCTSTNTAQDNLNPAPNTDTYHAAFAS